jgi:hypothetical protein
MSKRYRIHSSTIAIYSINGHRTTIHVPEDAIVMVREDPKAGDRLIDVVWNEKNYLMFTQDLRDRAAPLD